MVSLSYFYYSGSFISWDDALRLFLFRLSDCVHKTRTVTHFHDSKKDAEGEHPASSSLVSI